MTLMTVYHATGNDRRSAGAAGTGSVPSGPTAISGVMLEAGRLPAATALLASPRWKALGTLRLRREVVHLVIQDDARAASDDVRSERQVHRGLIPRRDVAILVDDADVRGPVIVGRGHRPCCRQAARSLPPAAIRSGDSCAARALA